MFSTPFCHLTDAFYLYRVLKGFSRHFFLFCGDGWLNDIDALFIIFIFENVKKLSLECIRQTENIVSVSLLALLIAGDLKNVPLPLHFFRQ